jgi:hypothetical protein
MWGRVIPLLVVLFIHAAAISAHGEKNIHDGIDNSALDDFDFSDFSDSSYTNDSLNSSDLGDFTDEEPRSEASARSTQVSQKPTQELLENQRTEPSASGMPPPLFGAASEVFRSVVRGDDQDSNNPGEKTENLASIEQQRLNTPMSKSSGIDSLTDKAMEGESRFQGAVLDRTFKPRTYEKILDALDGDITGLEDSKAAALQEQIKKRRKIAALRARGLRAPASVR